MTGGQRRGAHAILASLPATRLGVALVVLAIAVATIAPRELFSLTAEDSDRSVRRFRWGPANVLVLPRAPWAQVPAWLPGPADQWAGGSSHAIVLGLDPPPPRTLVLWMLREEYASAQQQLGFVETYPAYMHRLFGEPASPRWGIAADALRSFIAECPAHRTPVAIALFPHLSAGLSAGTYEFTELHDQVLDLCHQEGVPCIDLRSTFAAYRDYGRLWVHRFDAHPNALAHRLAGERLVEVLGPFWLDAGRALGGGGHPEAAVSRAVAPGSAASRFRRS